MVQSRLWQVEVLASRGCCSTVYATMQTLIENAEKKENIEIEQEEQKENLRSKK